MQYEYEISLSTLDNSCQICFFLPQALLFESFFQPVMSHNKNAVNSVASIFESKKGYVITYIFIWVVT